MTPQTLKLSNSATNNLINFTAELSLSKSPSTVNAYRHDLELFLSYLEARNIKRPGSYKASHVVEFLGAFKQLGRSMATLNRYYMSIREFSKWLRRSKVIDRDFTEDVPAPKLPKHMPRVPTIEQIEKLLGQPDIEKEAGLRDRAMLELMYSSGLRASEVSGLQLHHEAGDKVHIYASKRDKSRTVPINSTAQYWLQEYLKVRGYDQGYLFLTEQGKQVSRDLLYKIVCRHAKNAQLEEVTPHTLRHACATHLLDSGADLRLIQEVLGHSSIASTQRYTHLSSKQIQDKFNQFHPRKAHG